MYNTIVTTEILKSNIGRVSNISTSLILDTDAFEWCGRKFIKGKGRVWIYLVSNYNGYAESEHCIAVVRQKLSNLLKR